MLHLNTISDELLHIAQKFSEFPELNAYRMVGGTAVALHLGHRTSVDIDFFTNQAVDRQRLGSLLAKQFPGIDVDLRNDHHVKSKIGEVRIDLCDEWVTPFREAPIIENGITPGVAHGPGRPEDRCDH